jgi:hypothetical protein
LEAAERGELFGDAGGEGCCCAVFDVAEEVLDADFFGFFCFYCGGDVEECFAGFSTVLIIYRQN